VYPDVGGMVQLPLLWLAVHVFSVQRKGRGNWRACAYYFTN